MSDETEILKEPIVSVIEEDFYNSLDKLRDGYSSLPISTIQTILNLANNA
jgi:hypothetical protein